MIWLVLLCVLYLGLLIALTFLSLRPYRIPTWISPGSLGHAQEEIELNSLDGVRIRGWWCETPDSKKIAVLFHGYMMNRSELVPEAHVLLNRGYSCLLVDFRAHGASESAPSSVGYRERQDVIAAVGFARSRAENARVLLMGSSMGSAAVVFALAERPGLADLAVIDSAYSKLDQAISGWWRFLGGQLLSTFLWPLPYVAWPINRLNPFRIDVAAALSQAGPVPLLFFHGTRDNLAVPGEATRNYDAAVGPKKIVWLEGCGHSEGRWLQPHLYQSTLIEWLEEYGM